MLQSMDKHMQPVKMIDVGHKSVTVRTAEASGSLLLQPKTLDRILAGELAKGDAVNTARVAGIMAAKRTAEFVPLCHPLPLDSVAVDVCFEKGGNGHRTAVLVAAKVSTSAKTGVEMEALTAVAAALMTLYDMAKSIDRDMVISNIQIDTKTGGSRGDYVRSDGAVAPSE
jgi:cyclic pyranopterin phosphate synthase